MKKLVLLLIVMAHLLDYLLGLTHNRFKSSAVKNSHGRVRIAQHKVFTSDLNSELQ